MLNLEPLKDYGSENKDENCYNSVIISPKIYHDTKDTAWLTARDKKSNEQFKCKVSFGIINKVKIAKKFDQMNRLEISELNVNVSRYF